VSHTLCVWEYDHNCLVPTTQCRCSLCRDHARELSLLKPTLANYGVSMIAIGRGSDGIQKWVKGGSWQGDTYYEAEPDCPVSKALMLSNTANVWGLFAPKVRMAAVVFACMETTWFTVSMHVHQALKTVLSSSQSDIAKDAASEPWKLSGTFVFSQDGTLVYGMRQKQITDSPNLEELMNACRVASGTRATAEIVVSVPVRNITLSVSISLGFRSRRNGSRRQNSVRAAYPSGTSCSSNIGRQRTPA